MTDHNDKPFVLGFSNLDEKNPFAVQVREYLQHEVAKHPNVQLVIRDNDLNTAKAVANVREFAQYPVDMAIVFHIDERAGSDLVIPLMLKRIPTICIDIPLADAIFLGIDAYRAGTYAGNALAEWININWHGRIDKVLVLVEQRTLDVMLSRFTYALTAIAESVMYDRNSVLYLDNGGGDESCIDRVRRVLEVWEDERHIAVLAMNDKVAAAALTAVRAMNREQDIAMLSFDGTPVALQEFRNPESRLITSPSFRPDLYAQKLMDLVMYYAGGGRPPTKNYIEPYALTRYNVDEYLTLMGFTDK